jgi:hypothetical protein
MKNYKALKKQVYSEGIYSIVPIRYEDRMDIMKWRNEQIYHLRQNKPLTIVDQDKYFKNIVEPLFNNERPSQILFSFLENEKCVAYGGLVHINWIDKNAELSFIMNTELENTKFKIYWKIFISLIEDVSFNEIFFHKIFTFAYDIRPLLYEVLEESGFLLEAVLKEHVFFQSDYINVKIHSKINNKIYGK